MLDSLNFPQDMLCVLNSNIMGTGQGQKFIIRNKNCVCTTLISLYVGTCVWRSTTNVWLGPFRKGLLAFAQKVSAL